MAFRAGRFSVEPRFPTLMNAASLSAVVDFERVRVLLRRADGSIAVDTVVLFPVGAESVELAVDVPLSAAAGSGGENLKLSLGYVNAAGDTVFKGGPVDVTVVPKGSNSPPPTVSIPVAYSGPGSAANFVVIAPRSFSGAPGEAFSFTARALDAGGNLIPGTPIVWATGDPQRVLLDTDLTGTGRVGGARGTAKLYAQTLTGQVDSVEVTVTSRPGRLEAVSGDQQRGLAGRPLADLLVVRTLGTDGLPLAGVSVNFVAASGSVSASAAVSDANGVASTRWTLPGVAGSSSVTAAIPGLLEGGASVTFSAQVTVPRATTLQFTTQPLDAVAGASLGAVTVEAVDATNTRVTGTSGQVTLILSGGDVSARLAGTTAVSLVDGVASFPGLSVNRTASGYALTASAAGLTDATSDVFAVTEGAAAALRVSSDLREGIAGQPLPSLRVSAHDAMGNLATRFTGEVTLRINANPSSGALGGTATRSAVAGVATFDDISITRAGDGYTLAASASGLTDGGTTPFRVTSGAASRLTVERGDGQSAPPGTPVDTIVIRVTDALGNPVAGAGVDFVPAAGSGSVSILQGTTDANGIALARWTLAASSGAQRLTVTAAGSTADVHATAVGAIAGGPTKLFLGFDNLNITSGVATPISVFLTVAQPAPVTVTLSVLDTLSQWTTTDVVVPAGARAASASIRGRWAGTSRAVATAGAAGADTVELAVSQATVRLFNSYMYLSTRGDTIETRVELSAPAPTGGVIVSFDLEAPGIVTLAPSAGYRVTGGSGGCDFDEDPALAAIAAQRRTAQALRAPAALLSPTTVFIKPGETQAYLYVIGDSVESSTYITPIAAGYGSQSAYVNTYSRELYFGGGDSTMTTGVGGVHQQSVYRSTSSQTPLAVTITARTPGVVLLPASVVLRADDGSSTVDVNAVAMGATWIVASAPGFATDSFRITVRAGDVKVCCSQTVKLGTNVNNWTVSVYSVTYVDSARFSYDVSYRQADWAIAVTSRNPSVVVPDRPVLTIPIRDYYTYGGFIPKDTGATWLVYSSGSAADSVYITVEGSAGVATWSGSSVIAAGQTIQPSLYGTYPRSAPTNFSLTSSAPGVATVDSTAVLFAGSYYTDNFRVTGLSPGTATMSWTAAGFSGGSRNVIVTTPVLAHTNPGCTTVGCGSQYFNIVVKDTLGNANPRIADLIVSIASTDSTVLRVDSPTATISRGSYYSYGYVTPTAPGTAKIILSAPGHRPDTISLTITGSALPSTIAVSSSVYTVGKRQRTDFAIYRNGSKPAALVSIEKRGSATAISDTAFNVSAGGGFVGSLAVSGLAFGTDTLIFTAPGHVADTVLIPVTTPKLVVYGTSGTVLANYPYGYVQFYLADSVGNSHNSLDTLTFTFTSTDTLVVRPEQATMVLMPNDYYATTDLSFLNPGVARIRIQETGGKVPSDSTLAVTVSQPVLGLNDSYGAYIGMRQSTDADELYVYSSYPVLVPTWITLTRSAPSLLTAPDSVLMPAGDNYAYFSIAGRDTVGGLQLQASAPGFTSATMDVTVSRPIFEIDVPSGHTFPAAQSITVMASESGNGYVRRTTEPVRVTLTADSAAIASVDSSAVTIAAGSSSNASAQLLIHSPGRPSVTASDSRTSFQRYLPFTEDTYIYPAQIEPENAVYHVGIGQRRWYSPNVNFSVPSALVLASVGTGGHTSRTGAQADTIPADSYYAYAAVDGLTTGADTVVMSAAGFRSARLIFEVAPGSFYPSSPPASMRVGDVFNFAVYLRAPDGSTVEAATSTTLTLGATNGTWWNGSTGITSAIVADGAYYVATSLKATTVGTATFTISAPGYLTKSFNVQVLP
ncbi:MAG: hypothetical protein Q8K55_07105 [Gemmatimonadaceae bacterium]|nr:hypothetical protein [Gemmatimonadaceae bacterium]